MTIPLDWLICRTSIEDVEELVSAEGASDIWLAQWRHLLNQVRPGDALWEYFAVDREESPPAGSFTLSDMQQGYALVRDGEVVDWISSPESTR